MVLDTSEVQAVSQGLVVNQSLRGRTPVHICRGNVTLSCLTCFQPYLFIYLFSTRFLVADVNVKGEDDEQSDQSGPPVDDKHDHATQNRTRKRHPHVVVLKARAPPCGKTW